MKKILPLALSLCGGALLIGALLAANPAPAPAAAPAGPAATAPKSGHGPGEKLGLTDEQKTKLEAIRAEQRAALDAVRADQALSPADKRAKARGLAESFRGQMKAVLTAEQQWKMAHVRERAMHQRQQRMQGFGGQRGGPQGFGPGQSGFGFGPQQGPQGFGPQQGSQGQPGLHPSSPMEMIQQGNRMAAEGQKQLARQLGLSEEQSTRLRDLSRQQQEKAQALQKEFHEQMLGVLTPEQQEKAKAMHERRGPGGERPDRGPGRGRPDFPPDMPPPGK